MTTWNAETTLAQGLNHVALMSPLDDDLRREHILERTIGALLGVALGDALGLPYEGLSQRRVADASLERYMLVGRTGFVSDDTEQTALIAQALARHPSDDRKVLSAFRRSMVGWFLRLPFGIGLGTLRSCLRMSAGVRRPGVHSAGNGAAMRAGIIGVRFAFDEERRRSVGREVARLTHTDPRAIEGALFVAEVAAAALRGGPSAARDTLLAESAHVLEEPALRDAVASGVDVAARELSLADASAELGNTGFIVHTLAICAYCFARDADSPLESIRSAIRVGGDTDTHAAIVGGWLGAMHGSQALCGTLIEAIHDGPFGPSHLRRLAHALVDETPPPTWSWRAALLRNFCLYPVIVAHGFARLGRR